jgi:hypothetical protein
MKSQLIGCMEGDLLVKLSCSVVETFESVMSAKKQEKFSSKCRCEIEQLGINVGVNVPDYFMTDMS